MEWSCKYSSVEIRKFDKSNKLYNEKVDIYLRTSEKCRVELILKETSETVTG